MTTIQIKHRYSEKVLYECEPPNNLDSGMHIRHALEKACQSGAYLSGADLSGADLSGADLSGADLSGADLSGADLSRADLSGADLSWAYLSRADLSGADLSWAYLSRAYLSGALVGPQKLIGERPIFSVGPIGSRMGYLHSFITDLGIRLKAGCFFGTTDEFISKLKEERGDNNHAKEYTAALELIACHARIWTPGKEEGTA